MKTLFGELNVRETDEQAAFVQWWRVQYPRVLLYAIPNGAVLAGDSRARAIQMAKLKRNGLVPGVPDLHCPEWGLFIEMKRVRHGVVSPAQAQWVGHLRDLGFTVIVARGCDDAITQVLEWRGQA